MNILKALIVTFLVIFLLTACCSNCNPPPQVVPCYTCNNPPSASPYSTTVHCTTANVYRYDTRYPYGSNTYWYGGPCD